MDKVRGWEINYQEVLKVGGHAGNGFYNRRGWSQEALAIYAPLPAP